MTGGARSSSQARRGRAAHNQLSSAERVNGHLKDNCGGNFVRVRGAAKVFAHLMFGIIVLTVEQLMRLVT